MIIDASPNSTDLSLLSTGRDLLLNLEEMTISQIQQLPQLQILFHQIAKANAWKKEVRNQEGNVGATGSPLLNIVWSVFGGVPLDYLKLQYKV